MMEHFMGRMALRSVGVMAGVCMTAAGSVWAYGPDGHKLVGAVADQLLTQEATGVKVRELLDGMTLEQAAGLPDSIKAWDRGGPDDPNTWHLREHVVIEKQLKAFWQANQGGGSDSDKPNHNVFHYTDVPVATAGVKYSDAKHGTGKYDIVQMLPYCVRVLKGEVPEKNDRKITKAIALILLAHYVGDIHQPMHVGAQYFTMKGVADPDKVTAWGANGGNLITLLLEKDDRGERNDRGTKLHAYWDNDAVRTAKKVVRREIEAKSTDHRSAADYEVVLYFAKNEPKDWKNGMTGTPKECAEAWANEILPIAREAHTRLEFTEIHLGRSQGGDSGSGQTRIVAEEKAPQPGGGSYADWAGAITKDELHKAGWRLAELCRKSVK
jgi:hypothetical protein